MTIPKVFLLSENSAFFSLHFIHQKLSHRANLGLCDIYVDTAAWHEESYGVDFFVVLRFV